MKASADSSTKAALPRPTSAGTCERRPPERFPLDGPSRRIDPRTHAFRKDVADIALAGILFAPHYAHPDTCSCIAAHCMVRERPTAASRAVSQLVAGEDFAVVDRVGAWAWGRCVHDDYVGYVPVEALGPSRPSTHRVVVPSALVFADASIKAPAVAAFPIGTRLDGDTTQGDFVRVADGFVHHRHAAPLDEASPDPVVIAERLIGQPYLWGGRGGGGIDCSGLVQVALALAGIAAPRDSDQQRDALGGPLEEDEPPRRGDLVFMPGHVGMMVDGERLIHANAHWMAVTVEPLADVIDRLRPLHPSPISARRRIMA